MRILVDMNLSPAIGDWLRSDGHDVLHALDAGYAKLPDRELFQRAAEAGRVIVTFDLDFADIASLTVQSGASVLLLRLRHAEQSFVRERLRAALAASAEALAAGAIVLVEEARIRIRRLSISTEQE